MIKNFIDKNTIFWKILKQEVHLFLAHLYLTTYGMGYAISYCVFNCIGYFIVFNIFYICCIGGGYAFGGVCGRPPVHRAGSRQYTVQAAASTPFSEVYLPLCLVIWPYFCQKLCNFENLVHFSMV